ncbi:MAG TPA: DUF4252 domain-containing protein [Blastocatellia bacterium]|nr:DUF4252 domain-containing protein [Blastocatellia bacterium]
MKNRKQVIGTSVRGILGVILLVGWGAVSARAQDSHLQFVNLEKLAAKAKEVVDVSLDAKMLPMAAKFLSGNKPDEAAIRDVISKLKGIYVRVYEFENAGAYTESDLEPFLKQLQAPGWSKIVGVSSKADGEHVEIHLKSEAGATVGMAIISAEPQELAIVHLIGPIDLEKLGQLGGQFGIPKLDLKSAAKGVKKARNDE